MAHLKLLSVITGLLMVMCGGVVMYPDPLFAHTMNHGSFTVRSDRPIAPSMAEVLNDAASRIRKSELYDPDAQFRIYICNEPWRLWLFTRNTEVGGFADTIATRNIYLRETDIPENRLLPPWGTLADADVRTLSYFIAHEATHVLQSRNFGRLLHVSHPRWLVEGYADLIAKDSAFDFEENLRLLKAGDRRLSYEESGLYRRYHLMTALMMDEHGRSAKSLFEAPPEEEDVLELLLRHSSHENDSLDPKRSEQ